MTNPEYNSRLIIFYHLDYNYSIANPTSSEFDSELAKNILLLYFVTEISHLFPKILDTQNATTSISSRPRFFLIRQIEEIHTSHMDSHILRSSMADLCRSIYGIHPVSPFQKCHGISSGSAAQIKDRSSIRDIA